MVSKLETTSRLESEREVNLFPELGGIAVEVLAEEGDRVQEGDVLARLDHRDEALSVDDLDVALKEAKDNLVVAALAVEEATGQLESAAKNARQAERDFDRDQELYQSTGAVSPLSKQALEQTQLNRDQMRHAEEQAKIVLRRRKLERDAAETNIGRAEVALSRAKLNFAKKSIIAPFDGVISLRNIRIGDSVGTGEAAFVLTDTENLRATFSRPQEELALFSNVGPSNGGDSALTITATAEAYPGKTFEGYVERISPTIDAASGQFRVTARLHEAGDADPADRAKLLPGMLVRMEIVTERHPNALIVPKRALRREGDRKYVLVIEEQDEELAVRRVDVDERFEDDTYVEIAPRDGDTLTEGQTIVLVGNRDLRNGDPVIVDKVGSATPVTAPVVESSDSNLDTVAGE